MDIWDNIIDHEIEICDTCPDFEKHYINNIDNYFTQEEE